MPLRIGSSLPGYRNARASSSSRPLLGAAIRELPFSSTSRAQDDDPSPPKLEGFTVSNTAHQNIDEVSKRGLGETRARTTAQKESRKHAQRQVDHDKHAPQGNEQTSTQGRPQTSYHAPPVMNADPFAAPPPPATHPGRGQSTGRRSLLDRVSGDRDLNPHPAARRQPEHVHQGPPPLSADPFEAPLPSGPIRDGSTRRNVLDRVADDLFENPPETSHPAQKHPERGAPGPDAHRRGGYDYRGRGDGHRPDDARGGRPEDGGPSRNYFSNGPGRGPGPYGPGPYGPGRGGPPRGAFRGGYAARGGRGGFQGGPGRPMRGGPGGRGGPMRGGARGRGRGRGGSKFGGQVLGLGELADEDTVRRHMEHVVKLPPPQATVNDQSFVGLFGRLSMINPPIKGKFIPQKEWWAKDMAPIDARKSEVLRLAGSYDTIIPKTPNPNDPSLANNPKERAKAAYIWTTSMQSGVGMEIAQGQEAKVAKALQ